MKGITAVTPISRKYLASEVDTNDATLSTIITQLGFIITSTRPGEPVLHRVELKYFRARSSNKSHSYMVGFLFDPQADGKLVRINHQHIHEVMSFISSGSQLNRESTIMLVGKKGSRKDNRFTFKCNQNESDNVLIREFTSHDNIQSYISTLLSDFDRIESRYDTYNILSWSATQTHTGPSSSRHGCHTNIWQIASDIPRAWSSESSRARIRESAVANPRSNREIGSSSVPPLSQYGRSDGVFHEWALVERFHILWLTTSDQKVCVVSFPSFIF